MYAWLVTLHLVGLVVFLLCHAVSTWVAFPIRGEPDRNVVATLLRISVRGNQLMSVGLLLLGIGGLGATGAGLLLAPWVVAPYVILGVTLIGMWAMGAGFYYPIREGLEGHEMTPRMGDERLRVTLAASRRPEALAAIGLTSLLLVAVMVLMPG